MALPMLVSGADCGPVNPLQGLAKRFDQDRGIQQDQFVAGRAGPSRETFRTAQQANPLLEQEASRFFSGEGPQRGLVAPTPATNAFDVSVLHKNLPVVHSPTIYAPSPSAQFQAPHTSQQAKGSSWAVDFFQRAQVGNANAVVSNRGSPTSSQAQITNGPMAMTPGPSSLGMHWTPPPMNVMTRPQIMHQPFAQPNANASIAHLEEQFRSIEANSLQANQPQVESDIVHEKAKDPEQVRREADELARTAALLVETVKDEQNPKFMNSQFMRLMRGLRDGVVVVEGNDVVERSEVSNESSADFRGKGKERATDFRNPPSFVVDPSTSLQNSGIALQGESSSQVQESAGIEEQREEDPNEAYFRKENEDYIDYWNRTSLSSQQRVESQAPGQQNEWGALQESWDSFEATTWGVRPIAHYQFQPHNPYLNGETSQITMHHSMHVSQRSLYESVLELEAEVQRDPTNARAWYDLGVKQQENEREPKAIVALNRSLELDSDHLPSWLALAISYTNEGDRSAADDAILQWARRNPRYEAVVKDFFDRIERLNGWTLDSLTQTRRHDELIHCFMAMARAGNERGEVDADVQVGLAVLLNTSEDYVKARDCFKAALSVRPDDWQLYNRIGATLANSGSSEDALQYYYRALELNPAYIRARFNLGISYMNMRKYAEAANYILIALVMQESDNSVHAKDDTRGVTSSTLWDSLRTTCMHLQRTDLANLCDKRDLEGFRREFDF